MRRLPASGTVMAIDGVYSMSGKTPPLAELDSTVRSLGGTLYVDDAHGTGVVGPRGRGAAAAALGTLDNVLMVGSLSKAFSCLGGFVTCTPDLKTILKIRSSTFIFGGPVPPPYLAAICAVCNIFMSPEYDLLLGALRNRTRQLTAGLDSLGLAYHGGGAAIVSVIVGDIEKTFAAGKSLFDRGYYAQSATYPAVPINGGLLRIQINANHPTAAIDGLLNALADVAREVRIPLRHHSQRQVVQGEPVKVTGQQLRPRVSPATKIIEATDVKLVSRQRSEFRERQCGELRRCQLSSAHPLGGRL